MTKGKIKIVKQKNPRFEQVKQDALIVIRIVLLKIGVVAIVVAMGLLAKRFPAVDTAIKAVSRVV